MANSYKETVHTQYTNTVLTLGGCSHITFQSCTNQQAVHIQSYHYYIYNIAAKLITLWCVVAHDKLN